MIYNLFLLFYCIYLEFLILDDFGYDEICVFVKGI